MATQRATIYVTQSDNDDFFRQTLPTFRRGYCRIERAVKLTADPEGIWDFWGEIRVSHNRALIVSSGDGKLWKIQGWKEES